MFKILFNFTIFGKLDKKGFLPWQQIRKSKTSKFGSKDDNQVLFVVKLEPKSNILSLFGEREHLIYFWHFVRHYLYRSSSAVIPTLE